MKQKIDVIDDVGGDLSALPPARPHHETARTSREGNHRGGPRGGAKANGREHGREGGREHSREGGKENNREGGRDGGRERSREGGRERSRDHAAGPRHAERSGEQAGEHRSRDAARPQRDGQKSRVAPQGREEHRANGEGHKPHDGHQHREPRQNRDEHRGERRDDSRGQHRANGEGHTPREGRPDATASAAATDTRTAKGSKAATGIARVATAVRPVTANTSRRRTLPIPNVAAELPARTRAATRRPPIMAPATPLATLPVIRQVKPLRINATTPRRPRARTAANATGTASGRRSSSRPTVVRRAAHPATEVRQMREPVTRTP